jgi:hypothetical protein
MNHIVVYADRAYNYRRKRRITYRGFLMPTHVLKLQAGSVPEDSLASRNMPLWRRTLYNYLAE